MAVAESADGPAGKDGADPEASSDQPPAAPASPVPGNFSATLGVGVRSIKEAFLFFTQQPHIL